MTTITSPHNPGLKAVRRLHTRRERARTGRFVVEGEDLVGAAAAAGRTALAGYRLQGSGLGSDDFFDVERSALAAVSSLGSGTRVLGIYEQRWAPTPAGRLCVHLHGVGDPGNVGAVLRSAHAFGASCVSLGPACADPHSPKAVRASMGAIFAVSLARTGDVGALPGERIALLPGRGAPLARARELVGAGEVTLLIGAERYGLPEEVVERCEHVAHIAIASESLNAAMAATVGLYELTRVRSS
jgi:TrmH family RNA methyltransferase